MNRSILVLALMSLLVSCKVFDNTSTKSDSTSMAWVVSTFAGTNTPDSGNGTGTEARFNYPDGMAVDSSGNAYVTDYSNHRIRKITPAGVVSTLAGRRSGYKDGTGTDAQFFYPAGVAVDSSGNVYVADTYNHRIRKITPKGGVSTLAGSGRGGRGFADGTGTDAQFFFPSNVAVDPEGNVYVADASNHRIRKITPKGGVSTIAGDGTPGYTDGTGTVARFNLPYDVTVDSSGNAYVTDFSNHRIRKITPMGMVTTFAGSTEGFADGTGTEAQFYHPDGVDVDSEGNVYVADSFNNRIRKITPAGVVSTIAGDGTPGYTDGTGTEAQFYHPAGVAVDSSGNVYVGDFINNRIRKITPAGVVSTIAGDGTPGYTDGTGTTAQFNRPYGVAVGSSGNVYVADFSNHHIRKITPAGVVSTLPDGT